MSPNRRRSNGPKTVLKQTHCHRCKSLTCTNDLLLASSLERNKVVSKHATSDAPAWRSEKIAHFLGREVICLFNALLSCRRILDPSVSAAAVIEHAMGKPTPTNTELSLSTVLTITTVPTDVSAIV